MLSVLRGFISSGGLSSYLPIVLGGVVALGGVSGFSYYKGYKNADNKHLAAHAEHLMEVVVRARKINQADGENIADVAVDSEGVKHEIQTADGTINCDADGVRFINSLVEATRAHTGEPDD